MLCKTTAICHIHTTHLPSHLEQFISQQKKAQTTLFSTQTRTQTTIPAISCNPAAKIPEKYSLNTTNKISQTWCLQRETCCWLTVKKGSLEDFLNQVLEEDFAIPFGANSGAKHLKHTVCGQNCWYPW